jgi:alpha-beta hydrolase superfamily lysophospholipase
MVRAGIAIVALLVGLWALPILAAFRFLFGPYRRPPKPSLAKWGRSTQLHARTDDGIDLRVRHYPGCRGEAIIICGGYRSLSTDSSGFAAALQELGFDVLVHGWRATPDASGGLYTMGIAEVRDVRAVVDLATSLRGVTSVALLGVSIGALIALEEAITDPRVTAVCLDSPILSVPHYFEQRLAARLHLPGLPFSAPLVLLVRALRRVDLHHIRVDRQLERYGARPVLMILPLLDSMTQRPHQDTIAARARGLTATWRPRTDHCLAFLAERQTYVRIVADFVRLSIIARDSRRAVATHGDRRVRSASSENEHLGAPTLSG